MGSIQLNKGLPSGVTAQLGCKLPVAVGFGNGLTFPKTATGAPSTSNTIRRFILSSFPRRSARFYSAREHYFVSTGLRNAISKAILKDSAYSGRRQFEA